MTRPLVEALNLRPTTRRPVWVMRQAGRHLPEYREVRRNTDFRGAVSDPMIASELTLQPIRRYGMDGAVIFADIMTPLEAMGVPMEFDPGPRLAPHTLEEVARLAALDVSKVDFVAETISRVRAAVPDETAVIGFAGGPVTLLAYLTEGGGSKEFMRLRRALRHQPDLAAETLGALAVGMNAYLRMQVEAGADAVQIFDSWAGVLDRSTYADLAAPAAAESLAGLGAPRIYFAPGASHTLDLQAAVGADAVGVDWRLPIDAAWERIGSGAIQGNLDPATLLTDDRTIRRSVEDMMQRTAGRVGHVVNLGHGVDPSTPPQHVATFVSAVRSASP